MGDDPSAPPLQFRSPMPDRPGHFHQHRFPAEIISYAVWLYSTGSPHRRNWQVM